MHELRGALKKVAQRALQPRNPEPLELADYSQYMPSNQLKGKKMLTAHPKEQAKSFAMERVSRLRQYKSKNRWRVEELFTQDNPDTPHPLQDRSNTNDPDSSETAHARFRSANLQQKMNDVLNRMMVSNPSPSPNPTYRKHNESSQGKRSSGSVPSTSKRQEHKYNPFFKTIRRAQRRLQIRKEEVEEHKRGHSFDLDRIRQSNSLVKKASKLPPCALPALDFTGVIQLDSPIKAYAPKSRAGHRKTSLQ